MPARGAGCSVRRASSTALLRSLHCRVTRVARTRDHLGASGHSVTAERAVHLRPPRAARAGAFLVVGALRARRAWRPCVRASSLRHPVRPCEQRPARPRRAALAGRSAFGLLAQARLQRGHQVDDLRPRLFAVGTHRRRPRPARRSSRRSRRGCASSPRPGTARARTRLRRSGRSVAARAATRARETFSFSIDRSLNERTSSA